MPISVTCNCGKRFDVPDSYRGRTGKCTACGGPLNVPAGEADLSASSEQLATFGGSAGTDTVGTPAVTLTTPQPPAARPPQAAPAGGVAPGTPIGQYVVQQKLDAKGSVYLAKGPAGPVALKVLPAAVTAKSPTAGKRFVREARSLFGVQHPNLIRFLDAGEDMGNYYLAMEYFQGKRLGQVLSDVGGKMPEPMLLDIALGVARALDVLRERSLVHRNIKPEHILINAAGEVKIAGLGLVRTSTSDGPALTVKGAVLGTPQYMSPEQAKAGDLDSRSDLYGLGITMWVALTGELPFQDKVVARILRKLMTEKPAPVRELNPAASEAIECLIGKLVEKNPDHRYQSPRDLIQDLEAIKQGNLPGGLPPIAGGFGGASGGSSAARPAADDATTEDGNQKKLVAVVVVLALLVIVLLVAVITK